MGTAIATLFGFGIVATLHAWGTGDRAGGRLRGLLAVTAVAGTLAIGASGANTPEGVGALLSHSLASLLWVARQVQTSNRIAQADAYRVAQMKMAELIGQWSDDPSWMSLFVEIRYRGLRRDGMSKEDRTRAGFRFQTLLTHYSAIHRDVLLGILPETAPWLGTFTAQIAGSWVLSAVIISMTSSPDRLTTTGSRPSACALY